MAAIRAQKASWLALLFNLTVLNAQTTTPFWTYTSRFQISTSKYTYIDGDIETYSSTRDIKSGVTPTVTPYSTSTYSYYYSYDNLELVYAYYTDGAVPEADLSATGFTRTRTSSSSVETVFRMPVTYTAPASCPTQFTYSTDESVSVPTQVIDQVTPASVVTGTPSTYVYYTYGASVTETWYLTAGAAPLETSTAIIYEVYIADCDMPSSTTTYGYGGGSWSGGDDDTSISVCYLYSGCTSLKTWVIVIASIIPSLFVLGFIENYFWFRRLMLGKGALRFGTISWICISLWVACFTRAQSARSAEDQKLLRQKWNNTHGSDAFKLWWRWGFRHAYPVPLLGQYSRNTVGIVPAGQPLPQMGQTNPTYGPGSQPPPGPPGAPGAIYPSGVPPNGQPYYPPPQGWSPAPNGQGYPMPPPGQAYMPPYNGAVNYYGDQSKEAPSVTERTVSPPLPDTQGPYAVPSPPSTTIPSPPPANIAEAPTAPDQHAQLPTMAAAQPPPELPSPRPT